jgi:hypothetical protein
MDAFYIARRNAINSLSLQYLEECVETFHELRTIFVDAGVHISLSLPRQHALKHLYRAIHLFGSPNGLCSSITESKHITAVKRPWRRSSRFRALTQMLRTLRRMDKMTALHRCLEGNGMLQGFGFSSNVGNTSSDATNVPIDNVDELEGEDEAVVWGKSQDESEFDVQLGARPRVCKLISGIRLLTIQTSRVWLPFSPPCPRRTHQTARLSTCVRPIPLQILPPRRVDRAVNAWGMPCLRRRNQGPSQCDRYILCAQRSVRTQWPTA